jgi:hypothetical protein
MVAVRPNLPRARIGGHRHSAGLSPAKAACGLFVTPQRRSSVLVRLRLLHLPAPLVWSRNQTRPALGPLIHQIVHTYLPRMVFRQRGVDRLTPKSRHSAVTSLTRV